MTKKKPLEEPLPIPKNGRYRAGIGMRVQVLSGIKERNLGLGTITKVEELWVKHADGKEELISKNYPSEIVLDNGKHTEGLKCWWYPIKMSRPLGRPRTKESDER